MSHLDIYLKWVGVMALLVGALGFCIGFFGPAIFMPDANQGPLIGIFVLGPFGAVIGALVGLLVGYLKTRHESQL